jgi:hypothetical protein
MSELKTKIYKCEFCTFFTKYKYSLQDHNKLNKCKEKSKLECLYCKKKFQYPRDLERHKNKLKKCYISNKNDLLEIIENNEKDIKINIEDTTNEKNLEDIINENKSLKSIINKQKLESTINEKKLEDIINENNILKNIINKQKLEDIINENNILKKELETIKIKKKITLKNYSLILLDRDKIINNNLEKSEYIYKLEYHILKNTIFGEKNIDSENKEIFFLLLDIINNNQLEEFIWTVIKENRRDLENLMIEYGKNLKNRVKFQNNLYGKDIKEYEKIYNELMECVL